MSKYKAGDKVRIRSWKSMFEQYGSDRWGNLKTPGDSFTTGMRQYCGKILTVKKDICDGKYHMKGIPGWCFTDAMFETIEEVVIIYRKDNQVIAFNKTTNKKGIAYCSPEDKFNFYTGAELALARLAGTKEPAVRPENFYNAYLVCTHSRYDWFIKGKIYRVRDGRITDDEGDTINIKFKTFDELNSFFTYADFIEVIK